MYYIYQEEITVEVVPGVETSRLQGLLPACLSGREGEAPPAPKAKENEKGKILQEQIKTAAGDDAKLSEKKNVQVPGTPTKCAYLTDLEGDFKYFCRYVENSEVLEWKDEKKNRLKFRDKDSMLLFGGNLQERKHHVSGDAHVYYKTNTEKLTEVFGDLDRDGKGSLSLEELTPFAKAMNVTKEKTKALFDDIDKDQNGIVSQDEFLEFFIKVFECTDLNKLGEEKQKSLQQLLQKLPGTNIGGDIRLTKLLLDLKAQKGNEDRVVWIIGYREANKLRLASELQDECIKDPAVLENKSYPYVVLTAVEAKELTISEHPHVLNLSKGDSLAGHFCDLCREPIECDGYTHRALDFDVCMKCATRRLEEEDLSPQKYLKREGKENNGPTCYHTQIHTQHTQTLYWSLTISTCVHTLTLSLYCRTHITQTMRILFYNAHNSATRCTCPLSCQPIALHPG